MFPALNSFIYESALSFKDKNPTHRGAEVALIGQTPANTQYYNVVVFLVLHLSSVIPGDRHSVKPAEQLDILLVVVWLERRPLVDEGD